MKKIKKLDKSYIARCMLTASNDHLDGDVIIKYLNAFKDKTNEIIDELNKIRRTNDNSEEGGG